jgi:hypothetical protein
MRFPASMSLVLSLLATTFVSGMECKDLIVRKAAPRLVRLVPGYRGNIVRTLAGRAKITTGFEDFLSVAADTYESSPSEAEIVRVFADSPMCQPYCDRFAKSLYWSLVDQSSLTVLVASISMEDFRRTVIDALGSGAITVSNPSREEKYKLVKEVLSSQLGIETKGIIVSSYAGKNTFLAKVLKSAARGLSRSIPATMSDLDFVVLFAREVWNYVPEDLKSPKDLRNLERLRSIIFAFSTWEWSRGNWTISGLIRTAALEPLCQSVLATELLNFSKEETELHLLSGRDLRDMRYSSEGDLFVRNLIGNASSRADLIHRLVVSQQIDLNPGNVYRALRYPNEETLRLAICDAVKEFQFAHYQDPSSPDLDETLRQHLNELILNW